MRVPSRKAKTAKAEALRAEALKLMKKTEPGIRFTGRDSCWWMMGDEAALGCYLSQRF
jgi:hypothetical protein